MPQRQKLISHVFVRVNNNDLAAELMNDLVQVTVDTNLHLPDMFVIRVHDEQLRWTDQGPFELGAVVEIGTKPEEGGSEEKAIRLKTEIAEKLFSEKFAPVLGGGKVP